MEVIDTDVLIIGGGGAALRAAVEAVGQGSETTLVVKGRLGECGSTATGRSEAMGIAAALGYADPSDNPKVHFKDTIEAGTGLCDEVLTQILAEEAPKRLLDLIRFGVDFDKKDDELLQWMSDSATYPRACGKKGATGKAILDCLIRVAEQEGVKIFEDVMVFELLTQDDMVVGALGQKLGQDHVLIFRAKSTILATGGAGQVYSYNVFTPEMTGDGYVMAYKVGAPLVNMEFVQLGPAILHPIVRVISGSLWRLNPRLYNVDGEAFLAKYLPKNVEPSDLYRLKGFPFSTKNDAMFIDIAIYSEVKAGKGTDHGGIFFDVSHVPEHTITRIAPITFQDLLYHGIDIRKEPVEVGIVAQCFNGGVKINERAETGIAGLYAAGEVAGGLRGPDRPGGNSLAECQVFGARAGKYAAERARHIWSVSLDRLRIEKKIEELDRVLTKGNVNHLEIRNKVQTLMWRNTFVVRSKTSLEEAIKELSIIEKETLPKVKASKQELADALSTMNLVLVAKMITLAALTREESRGSHYREDFPKRDERWTKNILVYRSNDRMERATIEPRRIARKST